MKSTAQKAILTTLLILAPVFHIFSQRGSGWGPGSDYHRLYNTETIETINGAIVDIDKITATKKRSYGIHLIVETENETVAVHLGPGWYVENQEEQLNIGDKIEVTGSRVIYEGSPAIIAAEIKRGNDRLKLRDDRGYPVWSGWKKHKM